MEDMEEEMRGLRATVTKFQSQLNELLMEKLAAERLIESSSNQNADLESQLLFLKKLDRDRMAAVTGVNDDAASSVGSVGGFSAPSEYASVISGDVADLIADTVLHEEGGGPMTKLISRMIHLRDERDKYEVRPAPHPPPSVKCCRPRMPCGCLVGCL